MLLFGFLFTISLIFLRFYLKFDECSDETVTSPETKEKNHDAHKKYQKSIMSCPLCEKQMKRSQYYYHLKKTHKVRAINISSLCALLKCQA